MSEHLLIATDNGLRRFLRLAVVIDFWCEPMGLGRETWRFVVGLAHGESRMLLCDLTESEARALGEDMTRWVTLRSTGAFNLDDWLRERRRWEETAPRAQAAAAVRAYRAGSRVKKKKP